MEEKAINSAYLSFRSCAYRRKYETALIYCGTTLSFSELLNRVEYAYNTFCQMGVEPNDRVCLWLPNCPDLLASFYALSRLGAVGMPVHPEAGAKEVRFLMKQAGAAIMLTTAERYLRYCKTEQELPESNLVICNPEKDMKGAYRRAYFALEKEGNEEEQQVGYLLDNLMEENRYTAMVTPNGDAAREAVLLFGTSAFLQAKPITYLPDELDEKCEAFWRDTDEANTVYVENSFATEGGFLAAHGALTQGKTLIWGIGDMQPLLEKLKPDYLIGTEEFFWNFRQNAATFGTKWSNLCGGMQIGKPLTPLMAKFAAKAFEQVGGKGALTEAPVALKVLEEPLFFVRDYGVRLSDINDVIERLSGIARCRCVSNGGTLRMRLLPNGKEPISGLARSITACCRREMNPYHLPATVEFCAKL
ncbi:MAG: AMP-binding protein [Clostridia bacterium]|nr:AMP-binding protein [Clostridia bacterium]